MKIFNLFKKSPIDNIIDKTITLPVGAYTFNQQLQIYDTSYKTSWVKQAIDCRAMNLSSAEAYMMNVNTGKGRETHPFLSVYNASNIYDLSGGQLLAIISEQLDIYGNSYIYVAKNNGTPIELIPLPAGQVTPIYDRNNTFIVGYQFSGGNTVTYNKDEIIHFRNLSVDNFLIGTPTIASLKAIIDVDNLQQIYNKKSMVNGGSVSLALSAPGKVSHDVLERMRYDFNKNHGGADNAKSLIVMTEGMTLEDYGKNMKDMDYVEGRKLVRDEILARMSVPPVLVGINDSSNRSTALVEYDFFIKHTIRNIAKNIEKTFNNFINRTYGAGYKLCFEYEEQTSDTSIKEYDLLLKYGLVTVNEVREYFNYDSIVGGDELVKPQSVGGNVNNTPTAADNTINPQTENQEVTGDK